jgi:dipeptidyl aminopeptidase/acylaminoacyl peptidase
MLSFSSQPATGTGEPVKGLDFDGEPQFSPDGSMIAFTRFKRFEKKKSAIHVVATDGSGLQRLTPWKLNASHPDWSPDGQMIAFDSGDAQLPGAKGVRHGRRRQRADQAHRQPPTAHGQAHEA